jgi:hypothetical protein
MSFPDDEIQIVLLKLNDGRRVVRLVHVATGIAVEDDGKSEQPIVERRNALTQQLAEKVKQSNSGSR